MISLMCPESDITDSVYIGSNGASVKVNHTVSTTTPTSTSNTTITSVSTSILGDQTVTTTNINIFLKEDKILQQIIEWLINEKHIVSLYELTKIQVTEYETVLEYSLLFKEKNMGNVTDFVSLSEIRTIVVHDKRSNENFLISFEVI